MIKFSIVLIVIIGVCAEESNNARQKRLLFFDETGSLVRTYPNPYINHLDVNADIPYYGKFLNPFFSFIRAFGETIAAFTIPVSKAIIEQIKKDPNFQQSLIVAPKNPVVEPNPLCAGKRTQVPSPALCNNFLNCWDGWAFEQECPKGLLFSNEGYCDYAGNVDCHNRKLDPNMLQPQPMCNKDFEAFRNKDNCNEFFVCVNRQPVKFQCPADLAYSQLLGVCDYADRVDCKSSAIPSIQLPNIKPIPVFPPLPPSVPISPQKPFPDIPGITSPSIPVQSQPNKPVTFPFIPTPVPPSANPELLPSTPSQSALNPPAANPSASIQSAPNPPASISSAPQSNSLISSSQSQMPSFPSSELRPVNIFEPTDPKPNDEKPALPLGTIFTPGCAGHVAMSREDAIRQLQRTHIDY